MNSTRTRLNEIVKRYRQPIYNHALRILRDKREAEEVMQDVLLSIFKDLDNFRDESHLHTWIYKVTSNKAYTRRRVVRRNFVPLEEVETDLQVTDDEINPEHQYIKQETEKRVNACISQLPTKEGIAITLCYYENEAYGDIARILRAPPGTIASMLHRGKRHLHALLVGPSKKGIRK